MITLIIGENSYERDQHIQRIAAEFNAEPERCDGSDMPPSEIVQLTQGMSLFSDKRLVIIKGLSENKSAWEELARVSDSVPEDVHILLVEAKPDKRTKTYKTLQKASEVVVCTPFSEHDVAKAAAWLGQIAKEQNVALDSNAARELVQRIGTDQYALKNELIRLKAMGDITLEVVEHYTEPTTHENAFALLELALRGDNSALRQKIRTLSTSDDAYRTLGLLASQIYALAGLVLIEDEQVDVAQTLGVHPFVLRNLHTVARQLSRQQLAKVVNRLAALDIQLKSTASDPWLALEVTLSDITQMMAIKSST